MRDYALGSTFDIKFSTRRFTTGVPFTLAGSPAVAAYVDNNTTELTAGITLSVDFDGRAGLHNVRVVATSGNGYASGGNYALVLTAGTVDGVSVVGEVVGEFSLEAQSPLRPTTAGRTLDVTATGGAGLDWANVEAQGTTVNLTATTIGTVTDMATAAALADVQTLLNTLLEDLVVFRGTATAGSASTITLNTPSGVDDFYKNLLVIIVGGAGAVQARSINHYDGGSKVATVDRNWSSPPNSSSVFVLLPRQSVWEESLAEREATGSAGATLANLDVPLSSRASAASVAAVQTDVDDLQARLPAALVSGRMDASVGAIADNTITAGTLDPTVVDEFWDEVVDGSTTARESMRLQNAAMGGKAHGLETSTAVYRDLADTVDRITATTDAEGNRLAVTRNLT